MKKVEAIIKPFKLDEVKDALSEVGLAPVFTRKKAACKSVVSDHPKAIGSTYRTHAILKFLPVVDVVFRLKHLISWKSIAFRGLE
jgi:nitrogen regulatory protein PII